MAMSVVRRERQRAMKRAEREVRKRKREKKKRKKNKAAESGELEVQTELYSRRRDGEKLLKKYPANYI